MYTMTLTAENAKYLLEAENNLCEMIVSALKKYFSENGNVICAGLASMNGDYRTALSLMR